MQSPRSKNSYTVRLEHLPCRLSNPVILRVLVLSRPLLEPRLSSNRQRKLTENTSYSTIYYCCNMVYQLMPQYTVKVAKQFFLVDLVVRFLAFSVQIHRQSLTTNIKPKIKFSIFHLCQQLKQLKRTNFEFLFQPI